MADRVFFHLGTAKSGTTYVQHLLWANTDALREHGLLLPGRRRDHFHAAAVQKGWQGVIHTLGPAGRNSWARLLAEVTAWTGDALLSDEHFSSAGPEAAAGMVAGLQQTAAETHLVLTVRDLSQVLPSAWQQRIKHGESQPFGDFLEAMRDGGPGSDRFWSYQDVPAILGRWGRDLPPERVHVVVVPRPPADRRELLTRFLRPTGLSADLLTEETPHTNETLSLPAAELLRRVNASVPAEQRSLALKRLTKGWFSQQVLASRAPERLSLPDAHFDWVAARSREWVGAITAAGYDVVGSPTDLLSESPASTGRDPGAVPADEMLDIAVRAISALLARQAGD